MAVDGVGFERTWDGLPIAREAPYGASVVVRREDSAYLVLHRAVNGVDHVGDWAWTPPAGSRQPGESVYAGTLRELAEETGLSGYEPLPVDLSGRWALFGLEVPAGVEVRLDHEHDRYEWLPLDQAVALCAPEEVAEGLRRAAAVPAYRIGFRPLTRADLPDMVAWQRAPHAVRWFPGNLDLAAAERKYGPRVDGLSPTRVHVLLVDGRACGFVQDYQVRDYASYRSAVGDDDAVAIDYLIGDPELVGRGLGARVIWCCLRDVVLPAYPASPRVVASPNVGNERSLRVLEKAGFRRTREITVPGEAHPELLCVFDRAHMLGFG